MRKLLIQCLVPIVASCGVLSVSSAALASEDHPVEATGAPQDGGQETHETHKTGVPLNAEPDLLVWSIVVFIVFLMVLRRFAWGPLTSGLDKREAMIRQDIADAESARAKAEKMLAEHAEKLDQVQDEVREILAEARRDAEHTKNEIVEAAQNEAEATKNRAIEEIERSRDQALSELFTHMASNVAEATEHVLGRALSDVDQDRLIEEALSEVSG